jgi:hypothetical protein
MLAEHQVTHLLNECERIVGKKLVGVRGQLRSESHVRAAIWELIVTDSVSRIGRIEYQRPTPKGKTPDLHVETPDGRLWIEAAFLLPRFADIEARQEAFQRALWAQERKVGIAPGTLHHEFYGERAAHGFEMTLPAQHELPAFFRFELVRGFFESMKNYPQQAMMVDLGEVGATVRLAYVPASRGTSSSVVIEAPREAEEHAVYRLLTKKAKKYSARDLDAPLVVCIGSEHSTAVRSMGPMTVSPDTAIREACRKYPVLSAVIVVSIEDVIPSMGSFNTSRRAVVRAIANRSATLPLSDVLLRRLNLRFDLVDYGHAWNEWEDVPDVSDRMARLGGNLLWQVTGDGYAVTLPAHEVARVLGGGWSAADLQANYQMTDAENPFRRAFQEGRSIIAVEIVPHDPRQHDPPAMRITFGPPTPKLLQTPKNRASVDAETSSVTRI